MKYDFNSYLNRRETGSSKWKDMDDRNPNVNSDIIPMSVADMEFPLCMEIKESIIAYLNTQILGYSRPVDSYLESIVKYYNDYHGYKGKKEWIVTTPGVIIALSTGVKINTEVNNGVIIFTPVYGPFMDVIEEQNRKIVECPLIVKDNRYFIDFELLEKLAKDENNKLLMLCSPHNPSGRVWTMEELQKISKIAEENNLYIISDEIHSDIIYTGKKHNVLGTVDNNIGNRSIICTTASKTFNLGGLQCANIFIENDEMREKFIIANEHIGIERANVLGMIATQSAYENGAEWLGEVKTIIEVNNKMVIEFFNSYNGIFKVMEPDASFLLWINFENTNISHSEFMDFLDNTAEFFVNNGLDFGERGRNSFRLNTGLPSYKLEENLERLRVSLNEKYNII